MSLRRSILNVDFRGVVVDLALPYIGIQIALVLFCWVIGGDFEDAAGMVFLLNVLGFSVWAAVNLIAHLRLLIFPRRNAVVTWIFPVVFTWRTLWPFHWLLFAVVGMAAYLYYFGETNAPTDPLGWLGLTVLTTFWAALEWFLIYGFVEFIRDYVPRRPYTHTRRTSPAPIGAKASQATAPTSARRTNPPTRPTTP